MMKVYVVIGGADYEGEDFSSLKLFDCKSTALEYEETLRDDYDYTMLEEREVNMVSSLSSQK